MTFKLKKSIKQTLAGAKAEIETPCADCECWALLAGAR